MRILCLQHVEYEGPAAILEWAARRGHETEIVMPSRRGFAHPGTFDMLVVMGGPMNVDQELEYPWLGQEKALIRAAIDDGALVLGICLGAQLVAGALGAPTTRGEHPEIGWYPVELSGAAAGSAVFSALPGRFETLHWHGDTFAIPDGATHIARSAACENQAFEYAGGRVVGVQFHLEATPASWGALCEAAGEQLEAGGTWVSSADDMLGRKALFEPANELLFQVLDRMAAGRVRV